jgi:hypothetical protein
MRFSILVLFPQQKQHFEEFSAFFIRQRSFFLLQPTTNGGWELQAKNVVEGGNKLLWICGLVLHRFWRRRIGDVEEPLYTSIAEKLANENARQSIHEPVEVNSL